MATADTTEPVIEGASLPITPDAPEAAVAPSIEPDVHQPFRFSAAETLSPARQESLETWHRPFLRVAASNLRTTLRLDVELELESIQIETCSQLLADRSATNQALLFRMAPQPDLWLLDLPLPLVLLGVERMMGGTSTTLPAADKTHEPTELELMILNQFSLGLLGDYARNWHAPTDYKPEIVRLARGARTARAVGHQDGDLLVRISLRLVLKDAKTVFAIHMPIAAAEELLQRLGAGEPATKPAEPASMTNHKSPVASVPVPIAVRWQGFQIPLRDVEALQPGDVLMLDNKKCEHGVILLGDRARFAGSIKREAHKTVITLTHPLE